VGATVLKVPTCHNPIGDQDSAAVAAAAMGGGRHEQGTRAQGGRYGGCLVVGRPGGRRKGA
jgi:hypothetical protein